MDPTREATLSESRSGPAPKVRGASEKAAAAPPSPGDGLACGLCGGRAERYVQGAPAILRCSSCGMVALARFPDRDEREALYQEGYHREGTGGRFLGAFELLVRRFRELRARDIVRRVPGPAAVLDVGCGRGLLLEALRRRGWRVLGTQLSRTAARAAKERGVDVLCGELPELDLPPRSFRVATFYHVLEHVDRPEAYLRKTRELLEEDGLLVVEVPNCASLGFLVLGSRNFCVDYPNHLIFFTPRSLRDLLERAGFELEAVRHFSLEYSPFTTLQNLLNLLPGAPNRLYRALMSNDEGRRLRRSAWTWLHAAIAAAIALPACVLSLSSLALPGGNTMRFYCRKRPAGPAAAAASSGGATASHAGTGRA